MNLSPRDLEAIPRFLGIRLPEFLERFCTKEAGHFPTLRTDSPQCPFLDGDSRCAIYPVRPMQCRKWPFWRSNLADEARWNGPVRERCPGLRTGEQFARECIDAEAARTESGFCGGS